jgi:hypothetical protein
MYLFVKGPRPYSRFLLGISCSWLLVTACPSVALGDCPTLKLYQGWPLHGPLARPRSPCSLATAIRVSWSRAR